ncbi:MAG: glycoside hydrolase family 66 protein, partial [Phycisphaerae bacterium]
MAITNINPDKAGLPRWAEHGLFRSLSRYEGPAETAKMLLSGRWDFTPRRLWERVNAYNDELLKYARRHYVDILTVVWSPGFSHQGDQIQWQILRDYIRKAHRRGIRIIAYHSLTNCFWQEMFAAEPKARQWRQLSHDGGDVPYMAATYHGQVSRILLCVNNREWREYLKYKVRMALEAGVDGLFFDNLFSKCFCPICRQGFADYTRRLYGQAYEMPAPEPISEAELQARTG